jgi:hypothetical protein
MFREIPEVETKPRRYAPARRDEAGKPASTATSKADG